MKVLLLSLVLLGGASAAQAQLLPVPGSKNPDWVLVKTKATAPDAARVEPPRTDRMPNAARRSISSSGNRHRYWDDERQLVYNWRSKENSTAPHDSVNVRKLDEGLVYVYRRAAPKKSR